MKITIETIPHDKQRYPTAGDWQWDEHGNLSIKVSEMEDQDFELLVALHEFIEAVLTVGNGTTQAEVDEFDMNFVGDGDPGDSDSAPYHEEHVFAECMERILAQEMGLRWRHYEAALDKLG